jgi:hypothetical protein
MDIGECKDVMTKYLNCIKKVKGTNEAECRNIAKSYLSCRMDRYGGPPALYLKKSDIGILLILGIGI